MYTVIGIITIIPIIAYYCVLLLIIVFRRKFSWKTSELRTMVMVSIHTMMSTT